MRTEQQTEDGGCFGERACLQPTTRVSAELNGSAEISVCVYSFPPFYTVSACRASSQTKYEIGNAYILC